MFSKMTRIDTKKRDVIIDWPDPFCPFLTLNFVFISYIDGGGGGGGGGGQLL